MFLFPLVSKCAFLNNVSSSCHSAVFSEFDPNQLTSCSVVSVVSTFVHNVFQRSTQYTPTVVLSEKATPNLKAENSLTSYTEGTASAHSEGAYKSDV